jgi:hypothetical protein
MILAAGLCSLANPIQAKCPTYSVQIQGRIECSFKPGVRVVATLLFSGHKSEAPAKETAMHFKTRPLVATWHSILTRRPASWVVTGAAGILGAC